MKGIYQLTAIMIVSLSFTACGKKKPVKAENFSPIAQDWISAPPEGCAVGTTAYNELAAQNARSASGNLARMELGKSIESTMKALGKGYLETVVTDDKMSVEQNLSDTMKSIVNMDLYGARVVKTQLDGAVFHTLVCIDADALNDALNGMEQVSEAVKAGIRSRAKEHYKDLDAEIERLNQ